MMRSRILSWKNWLLILVLISRRWKSNASIICPKSLRFEKGSDVTIKCNITESDVSAIYWYKGTIPRGDPLVQLENMTAGGVEYGKGHFEITSAGAMVIKSVKLEHEGFYNILVAHKRIQFVGDKIELKITVLPSPPCPRIRSYSCFSCEDCSLSESGNGTLTCEMNFIRPLIPINWQIQDKQGVNITLHPQIATHDKSTDSWNVSVTLSYMAMSCNGSALVQCQAEDDRRLLHHPVVSASLKVDKSNCSNEWTMLRPPSLLIKTIILLLVILVALLGIFYIAGDYISDFIFRKCYEWMDNLNQFFYRIVNRLPMKVAGAVRKRTKFSFPKKWLEKLNSSFRVTPKRPGRVSQSRIQSTRKISSSKQYSSDEEEESEKEEKTPATNPDGNEKATLKTSRNSQTQRGNAIQKRLKTDYFSSDDEEGRSSPSQKPPTVKQQPHTSKSSSEKRSPTVQLERRETRRRQVKTEKKTKE